MIRFVCNHKTAQIRMLRVGHRGQGWVGETQHRSLAKRYGSLGWRVSGVMERRGCM